MVSLQLDPALVAAAASAEGPDSARKDESKRKAQEETKDAQQEAAPDGAGNLGCPLCLRFLTLR